MKKLLYTHKPLPASVVKWEGETPDEMAQGIQTTFIHFAVHKLHQGLKDPFAPEDVLVVTDLRFNREHHLHRGQYLLSFESGSMACSKQFLDKNWLESHVVDVDFKIVGNCFGKDFGNYPLEKYRG